MSIGSNGDCGRLASQDKSKNTSKGIRDSTLRWIDETDGDLLGLHTWIGFSLLEVPWLKCSVVDPPILHRNVLSRQVYPYWPVSSEKILNRTLTFVSISTNHRFPILLFYVRFKGALSLLVIIRLLYSFVFDILSLIFHRAKVIVVLTSLYYLSTFQ